MPEPHDSSSTSLLAMELPEDLLSRRDLSTGEKVTLTYLYRRAQRDQLEAWPHNRTLADATGQTVSTVQRHLLRLEKIDLIERGRNSAGRTIHLLRPTSPVGSPTPAVGSPHLTGEVPPPHQCASLHLRKLPKKLPERGPTKEAEASAPPLSGDNPAQVRSAPAPRPTPEVETGDGAQQSIAGCDPGDGAERPRKVSKTAERETKVDAWADLLRPIYTECKRSLYGEGQREMVIRNAHRKRIRTLIVQGYTKRQAWSVFTYLRKEAQLRKEDLDEGKQVSGGPNGQTAMHWFDTMRCLSPTEFQRILDKTDERKAITNTHS